ncbi:DUF6311 domain-containing protein [Devosia sp. 63-57]|uniref:DUF6311 domain-containing protein n=1 Tax=Devosia sp. 63-57 TaxID=1895751 RepID=UPI00086C3DC0|nr:DUF6311 domain-containing protein [Devosia sp. 63-57]ODT47470.1 MAG: hypothetical protein ABS74_14445 [Pelagibacterium sp. SCN 63-126]ODU86098.1 MAG: hypothetical protein ABT14_09875 [Pelagibacterium sp. SCN 63-17]OJX42822.1 MAG: hypothetical protein BGO80_15420 [Devosia sp. 63-57]
MSSVRAHWLDIAGFVASCLVGALFLWIITPDDFIKGYSSYWQTQVEDVSQYISGYRAYLAAPWQWPLLGIPSLNWPHGTTLTFVDAIPAFSFVLKLLNTVIHVPLNPLGYWMLVCYGMQGGAAWLLGRQLAGSDLLRVGLVVALCILMPSLTARMGHSSLQAHFLLLLALTLYFRGRAAARPDIVLWTVLLLVSFYVNFYITAMVAAVMVASTGDRWLKTRKAGEVLASVVPVIAVVASVPIMLGTAFGQAVPDTGFGFYSMNVLSPIGHGFLVRLPFYVPGTGGQYEGYNYLGLGLIALLALSVWLRHRQGKTEPAGAASYFGPVLVCILALCVIYALSNHVYVSDVQVLEWQFPSFLTGLFEAFRSSGRFFWLVSYALVAVAALSLGRVALPLRAILVVVALVIQLADMIPTYREVGHSLEREPHILADMDEWRAELAGVTTIHAFPKFKCPGGYAREVLPLQSVAAEAGYNLTTGFISRYGADCEAIASEIDASDPATSAYVFATTHFTPEQIASYMPENAQCKTLEIWSICRVTP